MFGDKNLSRTFKGVDDCKPRRTFVAFFVEGHTRDRKRGLYIYIYIYKEEEEKEKDEREI